MVSTMNITFDSMRESVVDLSAVKMVSEELAPCAHTTPSKGPSVAASDNQSGDLRSIFSFLSGALAASTTEEPCLLSVETISLPRVPEDPKTK